jgi:hypothetical protein
VDILSWPELHEKHYGDVPFLLDPYIPERSIVLLWSQTSIGKSPVTWKLAQSVGEGSHFFGLPSKRKGRVLYVECDTPEMVIAPRIKKLMPSSNVWWLFSRPIGIPHPTKEVIDALRQAQKDIHPDLVFFNTLRKIHDMDDKDSKTPKMVYGFCQEMFPKSALFFIHHERKRPSDPRAVHHDKETFSGSMHWLDDAQVGLQLERWKVKGARENLRLHHRKSQVSPLLRPMPLKLWKDGSQLFSPLFDQLEKVYELVAAGEDASKGDLDKIISDTLKVSITTARRLRYTVEGKKFPGSRAFLEKTPEEEEEEDED